MSSLVASLELYSYHCALNNTNTSEHSHIIHVSPTPRTVPHTICHSKRRKRQNKSPDCLMETTGTAHGGKKQKKRPRSQLSPEPSTAYRLAVQVAGTKDVETEVSRGITTAYPGKDHFVPP